MRQGPRSSYRRRRALARPLAGFAALAALLMPTQVAFQDMAGLVIDSIDPSTRWAVTLADGPGGESAVVAPRLGEVTPTTARVEINGGSVVLEGSGGLITSAVGASAYEPEENRIDRSWKGDLPMSVTTPPTARGFSAGTIGSEESRLVPPGRLPTMAFEASTAPLSILAVARFIRPKPETTVIADLGPIPIPPVRPHTTTLVSANYPLRGFRPASTNRAASALISAYAPTTSVVSQDMFAALFATPGSKPAPPPQAVAPGDHWWAVNPLPALIFSAREQRCLAEAIYFEARSEPYRGQVAVAQVVLNRVKNPAYPQSICSVVYQNRQLRNECQFSFACDGRRDVVTNPIAWRRASKISDDITHGRIWLDDVGTATHYHALYVKPNWSRIFRKKAKIGLHVFYQTNKGGWS